MAVLFPREIPTYVEQNPLRSAECRVFRLLENQLEDQFHVFYSRPWLGLTPEGEEIDGEADFVVAHPTFGIHVLEVKGGRVARDGATGTWTSTDRNGIVHTIKDPGRQARQSKYYLLEKLKNARGWESGFVGAGHSVILPDSADPGSHLAPDLPRSAVAFAGELPRLGNWVSDRMKSGFESDHRTVPLGSSGLSVIDDVLAGSFRLNVPLASSMAAEDDRIDYLTEQQFFILDFFERNRRCAIEGGAGSGKTVLASELAYRRAEAGERVLLTCFNRPLARRLKRRLEDVNEVEVATFHAFRWSLIGAAGLSISQSDSDSILLDSMLDAIAELGRPSFDTIIVDEAQDFRPEWLSALEVCLVENDSARFYVFGDSNQRVYREVAKLVDIQSPAFPLSRNLRNTRQIFDLGRCFYTGGVYTSAGPTGREVAWLPTEGDLNTEVMRVLGDLTKVELVPPGQIAVLAARATEFDSGLRRRIEDSYHVVAADVSKGEGVILDTIRRFKGLESKVVILLASRELAENNELLYVATTRARLHLCIVGPQRAVESIRSNVRRRSAEA